VDIVRYNRANGRGWYESALISLGSVAPLGEEQGQDPTPAEATELRTQRRGPGRPRRGTKRARTEDEPEPNNIVADAESETRTNTHTQTPQLREGPRQRSRARALSAPSTDIPSRALRQTQTQRKSYTQQHGQESGDEQSQYHSNEDPMKEEL